jgi:AbrB family looped-hinge helix DNA binding protein
MIKTKIQENGRLVIPAAYRKALGLKPGDEVNLILEDDEIRLTSVRRAVARAQTLVRRYVAEGRSLSGELIQERQEERDDTRLPDVKSGQSGENMVQQTRAGGLKISPTGKRLQGECMVMVDFICRLIEGGFRTRPS